MILFFISLHHKTLPLLNKCAVSCWLSTVKKTRNGGSFKISLVHRMTSTNIKMYEVNLWQCNQSTWKSRKAQCTTYPKIGSNSDFSTFENWYILNNEKSCFKRWISKSERTHWLIIRPKFLLWSHYTSGACLAFLWSAPGAGGAQTNQRFIFCCLWYIWENPFITRDLTLHFSQMLQLHEWEHQQFKQYSLPYNIDLDHELQNVATSCFKAAALSIFQRGHFTTCSSRGRRDVNTREF